MRLRLNGIAGERWVLLVLSLVIALGLWFSVKAGTRQILVSDRAGTALRTVPVTPILTGVPAEGFAVRGVEVRPSVVTLAGRAEVLNSLDTTYTTEVDVTGARTDFVRTVELRLPSSVRAIGAVTVSVRIGPALTRWTVPAVRVVLLDVSEGLRAEVSPAVLAVEVVGPPGVAGAVRPADMQAEVSAAGLGVGDHRVRPRVLAPPGVRVVALRPAEVIITVRGLSP